MKAGNKTYQGKQDLSDIIPVFPLAGALLLPGGNLALNIFEQRYMAMVDHALSNNRLIGLIQPDLEKPEVENGPALSKLGCIGRLSGYQETGDGKYKINLTGICRFKPLEEQALKSGFRSLTFSVIEVDFDSGNTNDPKLQLLDRQGLLDTFRKFLDANEMETDWDVVENTDDETLVTALCMLSPYGPAEKQALLEAEDLNLRAQTLIALTEFSLANAQSQTALQ